MFFQRQPFFRNNRARFAGFLALCASPAMAADITVAIHEGVGAPRMVMSLNGIIEKQDAETIRQYIDGSGFDGFGDGPDLVLSLNSPGGSYTAGLAIADVLREKFVATYVAAGAKCESACALAFMGGTDGGEGGVYPDRTLHPLARLGFHSPSLTVPDSGTVPVGQVATAYDIALKSMAGIVDRMEELNFPRSLLSTMLSTPASAMYIVENVDDINRWDIFIDTDWPDINLTRKNAFMLCQNNPIWQSGASAINGLPEPDPFQLDNMVERSGSGAGWTDQTFGYMINDLDGIHCYVNFRTDAYARSATITTSADAVDSAVSAIQRTEFLQNPIRSSYGFPPQTPIAALPPRKTLRIDPPVAEPDPVANPVAGSGATAVAAPPPVGGACLVYSGTTQIDAEPCSADFSVARIERYTWPSGAVTVIDRRGDNGVTINGKPIFSVSVPGESYCVGNSSSGNAFCYRGN
jgi:hypothetical protein